MEKKEEIKRKDKMSLIAFLFFCSGLITGGMIERIDTNNRIKENSGKNAKIVYQGAEHPISDLYQLTKMDESHVCILDSDIYYDIQSGALTSIKGYEEAFGYDVVHLTDFFPYEEYESIIHLEDTQKSFDEVTKENNKGTTRSKVKVRENMPK